MAYVGYNDAKKRCNEKYLAKFEKILLRITPDEKKAIEQNAAKAGKSVNQFLKDRGLYND